jgi:hypothetical protein
LVATFFLYKVRLCCTECGDSVVLEGPTLSTSCPTCRSTLEFTEDHWKGILGFRKYAAEYHLADGGTRGSSLSSGEMKFLVKWGPMRPACVGCSLPLDLTHAPPGTDAQLSCACGAATSTFPPPAWLSRVEPEALQLFGAVKPEAPTGAVLELLPERSPISFACPDCGANLKIGTASPRVVSCHFCNADLYMPDPLWRELHPVKKRVPWFVAYR